jgi:hypothetical protein
MLKSYIAYLRYVFEHLDPLHIFWRTPQGFVMAPYPMQRYFARFSHHTHNLEESLTKSQPSTSILVISFFFPTRSLLLAKMKLTKTPPAEVFSNFKCTKNPRSCYCPSISGFISVGDFVYLSPTTNMDHIGSNDGPFANLQMMEQFRSTKTFGQVTNLYDAAPQDPSSRELYLH